LVPVTKTHSQRAPQTERATDETRRRRRGHVPVSFISLLPSGYSTASLPSVRASPVAETAAPSYIAKCRFFQRRHKQLKQASAAAAAIALCDGRAEVNFFSICLCLRVSATVVIFRRRQPIGFLFVEASITVALTVLSMYCLEARCRRAKY